MVAVVGAVAGAVAGAAAGAEVVAIVLIITLESILTVDVVIAIGQQRLQLLLLPNQLTLIKDIIAISHVIASDPSILDAGDFSLLQKLAQSKNQPQQHAEQLQPLVNQRQPLAGLELHDAVQQGEEPPANQPLRLVELEQPRVDPEQLRVDQRQLLANQQRQLAELTHQRPLAQLMTIPNMKNITNITAAVMKVIQLVLLSTTSLKMMINNNLSPNQMLTTNNYTFFFFHDGFLILFYR